MKKLKFVNKSPNFNPRFSDDGSSGFDLRAWIDNNEKRITLKPLERALIHTGIYFEVPEFCEIQVRPRSGLAIKKGLSIINTPGTIDESYTGECCILAVNLSDSAITIEDGDRIAQGVLCPVLNGKMTELIEIEEITKVTERNDGGFGHTGVK